MELDFTKLNSLAFAKFTEPQPEKQPLKTPTETLLDTEKYKTPLKTENAVQRLTEGLQGIPILQRQADANKAEKERALAVYREYQQNIKTSSQLQTEILKGAKAGENVYSLFLKACKAIALMTSNSVFYSQLEGDIKAIYGQGLLDPLPLQIELQETQERLQRLRKALNREIEADEKDRIQRAIKAHEAKIAELESLIKRAHITT